MVVPSIWVPLPKTQENWPNAKKCSFLHFLVSLCKKISNGRQSDNFGPRGDAYGPSESLCPKFSETPLRKSKIFKIEGVMPLQSQVIPICVPQKRCFFGTFLEKILFLTHFDQSNPPMIGIFGKLCISAFCTYPNIRVYLNRQAVRILLTPGDRSESLY